MLKFYTSFLFILLLTSCGTTVKYVGQTATPAITNVDVYVDARTISKSYTVIGKGYANSIMQINPQQMQRKALFIAKQKGADAILFEDYFVLDNGSTLKTTVSSDSLRTVSSRVDSNPVVTSGQQILFLKYK